MHIAHEMKWNCPTIVYSKINYCFIHIFCRTPKSALQFMFFSLVHNSHESYQTSFEFVNDIKVSITHTQSIAIESTEEPTLIILCIFEKLSLWSSFWLWNTKVRNLKRNYCLFVFITPRTDFRTIVSNTLHSRILWLHFWWNWQATERKLNLKSRNIVINVFGDDAKVHIIHASQMAKNKIRAKTKKMEWTCGTEKRWLNKKSNNCVNSFDQRVQSAFWYGSNAWELQTGNGVCVCMVYINAFLYAQYARLKLIFSFHSFSTHPNSERINPCLFFFHARFLDFAFF